MSVVWYKMNGFKKGSQNDETKTMFEIYMCGVYACMYREIIASSSLS